MKKLLFFLLLAQTHQWCLAQAPQLLNYQGIARNTNGELISNTALKLRFSILPYEGATSPEYEELQLAITNQSGLYSVQIGNGQKLGGSLERVKWETGNKYVRVSLLRDGDIERELQAATPMFSVPYALYAEKTGVSLSVRIKGHCTRSGFVNSYPGHSMADTDSITKFTGLNTIGLSQIFARESNIGVGITTPLHTGTLHIKSVTGQQPVILESGQGVHCLFMENGIYRGYFGSYTGSGGVYPTPFGTSDADFDLGTTGNQNGKLYLTTETNIRMIVGDSVALPRYPYLYPITPLGKLHVSAGTFKLGPSGSGFSIYNGYPYQGTYEARFNNEATGDIVFKTDGNERLRLIYTGVSGGMLKVSGQIGVYYTGGNQIGAVLRNGWFIPHSTDSQWVAINGIHINTYMNANVGIGSSAPAQLLTVYNGNTTGTYTTSGWMHSSDARLKTNITPLTHATEKLKALNGVLYEWNNSENEGKQIGFIAQDVAEIFPEVVMRDEEGNYSMAYQNLIAPLVEVIRERQVKIDWYKEQIVQMKKRLATLESN